MTYKRYKNSKKINTMQYINVIIKFLNLLNLTKFLSSKSDISLLPITG